MIRDIAPAAFWPRPRVESRAVCFTRKAEPLPVRDAQLFLVLVRGLFSTRRKTVKNNMTAVLASLGKQAISAEALLREAAIPLQARAESLTVYDFIRLSDILSPCDE